MKKLVSTFIVCFLATIIQAQSFKVKRVIDKYDVKCMVDTIKNRSAASFWKTVHNNNKRFIDFEKAFNKKNETLGQALIVIDAASKYNNEHESSTVDYDSLGIALSNDLGISKIIEDRPIKFILQQDINASMDAYGQMRINWGAVCKLSYEELLAICAHETAHYTCLHVVSGIWKTAKKYKNNRMWADIGAGLFIGAAAATSAYTASSGYEATGANKALSNADIIFQGAYNYADNATEKFHYRYSRDEESEADIIAYRFLEYIGSSGDYLISAFKKMKLLYGDSPEGDYEDHPTLSFRIEVLEAMKNGYGGKRK